MAGRSKSRGKDRQGKPTSGRGLENPYGLAVPVKKGSVIDEKPVDGTIPLRCPSCGKKIPAWSKWWDTMKAWYTDSYRLIRCRKCGTRFAARRKISTTNKI